MANSARIVFKSVRDFSSLAVAIGLLLSIILSIFVGKTDLNWQVALALIAIAIGIPHGAVDHLIALKSSSKLKMASLISGYVAIAAVAVLAILKWNVLGFQLVLVMSFLHFGFGDMAFISETDRLSSKAQISWPLKFSYALAIGSVPVLIPLTKQSSINALAKVNPHLINWAGSYAHGIYLVTLIWAGLCVILLLKDRRIRELLDLLLLVLLAVITPPLVAFALYFGSWHAMRHTARLTLLLPKSIKAAENGKSVSSFFSAVLPGLPALALTLIVAAVITVAKGGNISANYLWYLLVVVWALTVPHMMVTARIDRKALR